MGPLRPVVWFRFHTRAEARRLAGAPRFRPRLVWQGADPDLHPQQLQQQLSSAPAVGGAVRSQPGGKRHEQRAAC